MRFTCNLNFQSCITCNVKNDFDQDNNYSKVKGIQITQVRLQDLVEMIYPRVDPTNDLTDPVVRATFEVLADTVKQQIGLNMLITRYCIHRLLTCMELYRATHWRYRISNDYFGQEIEGIYLEPEASSKLDAHLAALQALSDNTSRIEYVFKVQFGHLIDAVRNQQWSITSVSVNNLQFSNIDRLNTCRKLRKDGKLSYLDGYRLPRAICIKDTDSGKFKVIDGYHRVCAAEEQEFLIIYCQKKHQNDLN